MENSETPIEPPARQGPSCWAVGGIGCLVMIVVGLILTMVSVHQLLGTKEGKEAVGQARLLIKAVPDAVACETKLREVYGAISRYREKNGAYPPDIKSLVPMYLPQASSCHCSLDRQPDPAHLTFTYAPPTPSSKRTDRVLSFTWTQKITIDGRVSHIDRIYYFTVSGKEMVQQTSTDFDGHTQVVPPQEQPGGPAL